jgi:hypothetical protein
MSPLGRFLLERCNFTPLGGMSMAFDLANRSARPELDYYIRLYNMSKEAT